MRNHLCVCAHHIASIVDALHTFEGTRDQMLLDVHALRPEFVLPIARLSSHCVRTAYPTSSDEACGVIIGHHRRASHLTTAHGARIAELGGGDVAVAAWCTEQVSTICHAVQARSTWHQTADGANKFFDTFVEEHFGIMAILRCLHFVDAVCAAGFLQNKGRPKMLFQFLQFSANSASPCLARACFAFSPPPVVRYEDLCIDTRLTMMTKPHFAL